MPSCPICSDNVSSLPQHTTDCHTTPADMVISGVLTKFVRDGDDDAIGCPVSNCTNRHRRRSNFLRHLKNDHDLNSTTPHSNGKRSLSSSLENLSEGARKKTKLVVDKVRKVFKSDFFSNILLVLWTDLAAFFWSQTAHHEAAQGHILSHPKLSGAVQFPSYLALPRWGASCSP